MEIRRLAEADAGQYREIRLRMLRDHPEAFGSSYEEYLEQPPESVAARFRDQLSAADNFVLGAFEGEQLIATMGLYREHGVKSRHKGLIWGVYTVPEARGRGIGRRLMEAIMQQARAIEELELLQLAVASDNLPARRLYESLGFRAWGIERHALKIGDAYVDEAHMALWLVGDA
jgi:RimJ/RimL family protein N-acetyltransferase